MGKNWAIVIGINNYDNLQPLKYAKRDAEVMAAWLREEAQFEQVFLFTEDSPPIPTNPPIATQLTHARLRRFLQTQFEDTQQTLLKPGDNLWFFFAGHGRRFADQDYLMLPDSNPAEVESTAISVDYVTQRLRRSGADNVVLFLDACRDQGDRMGLGIGEQRHQGVITFYSCTANQQSWEIDELQHGSFTHTLLQGLRLQGEANCATVERLEQYLRYQVPQLNVRYGKPAQYPYLEAEPPYKMYFILLEQAARLKDVEPLKYQASLAENKGDLLLAEQLWVRVLAVSRGDWDAFDAIKRIAVRQGASPEPIISISEPIIASPSGERSVTSEPTQESQIAQQAEAHRQNTFEFETVTVDERGEVVNRYSKQAKFFKEDLGNGVTLEMVSIPAGSFKMGSPPGEKGRNENEGPQHTVNVPTFFLGKFEVTQEQYQQVMDKNPSTFKGAKRPVEQVSWNDTVEFCKKLSQKTGRIYRLPSEAEWEYACRAGTTTPFHFGGTVTTELANYKGNDTYASAPKGKYQAQTTEVGSFPPNAFGLYDMHGNVWEWCADTWHDSYKGAPVDGKAWIDNDNSFRVLRGGSWYVNPLLCRSAYRNSNFRAERVYFNYYFGFRVVCAFGRTS
ncbi:hypothetical protein NIES4073_64250 [Kalymmatonema gypsitolerans NIES-4073]|nr:hypothetical protein NIES4073_64250 [Scytonema sp. NIES-4073]